MRNRVLFATAGVLFASTTLRAQQNVAGTWYGAVSLAGGDFSLRVDLTRSDSGVAAVMSIRESKLIGFPVPDAQFVNRSLRLSVPKGWGLAMFRDIGLAEDEQIICFEGDVAGDSIPGTLQLAYAKFPMTLRRAEAAAPSIRQEAITFANGDVSLSGTLYLPERGNRFPAVVFTHSSGEHTRAGYAQEAERLAAVGVAALVYDKRGAGKSTGANWTVATFDELADDAAQAVRALRSRPDIDSRRIGLYGLSQGTWLIGMVAARIPDIGFLVFVSGSGISVWEQEVYRTGAMMRAAGYSDAEVTEAQAYQRTKFAVARTGVGWRALDSLSKVLKQRPARWFDGYAQDYASLSSARFWWLAAFHYDPMPVLEHLTMPVLGLFGDKDLSFPIPAVVDSMRAAFRRAGNKDVTLKVFAGAEHQLMVPQAYGGRMLRRVVTPEYLPTFVNWVMEHATRRK